MSQKEELEKIRKELELSNKDTVRRRGIFNPILWFGVLVMSIGLLLCMTIIGLPIGLPLYQAGKPLVWKNYGKKNGL